MTKRTFYVAFATIAVIATVGSIDKATDKQHSGIKLANILALTNDNEDGGWETRKVDTISIRDDEGNNHKSITTIICEGKGSIICP